MERNNCKTTCIVANQCQYLPDNERRECMRGCITTCNTMFRPATTLEETIDNALIAFTDPTPHHHHHHGVSNTANDIIEEYNIPSVISSLYTLVSEASSFGSAFDSIYKSLTGNSLSSNLNYFFQNTYSTNDPQQTYQACEKLSDDIKKALAEVHKAAPPPGIPQTCVTGTIWNCDETYIRDRHTDIKRLQEEIDTLLCQIQGKVIEKEKWEKALANCVKKLDKQDEECKSNNECPKKCNCSNN
jgi:hypothetical protein